MKFVLIFLALIGSALAQTAPVAKSATVPITLDHNRIIIDVHLPLPDGSTRRVRGWVDNGNPDLSIAEHAAQLMGLKITGEAEEAQGGNIRTAPPPKSIMIGDMSVVLRGVKEARITSAEAIAPGLSAEIDLPSSLLRNYDVLIDYPDREFTIAESGTLHFNGVKTKVLTNAQNGLMQVPSKIEGKSYSLALDLGAPIGFLDGELVSKLLQAHPRWPHMTGGIGIANLWGVEDEPRWQLMRIPELQYGPLSLTDIVVASLSKDVLDFFEKRAGVKTAGIIGANALLNYRVGLDYAHETVYFDIGRLYKAPDMDVIGLILRPEADGRYTVLGVADYDGKPSVPEVQRGDTLISVDGIRATGGTMGQVWSSLEGSPGKERTLMLERAGRQFTVKATVRRFLETEPEKSKSRK
jgi:hypothetical protein